MTNRVIVYPGAIPQDTDILSTNQNAMIALGWLAQALVGTGTWMTGLACTPTSPASLVVNVGDGAIFALEEVDPNAYGSFDTNTNPLVKIGINDSGVTPFTIAVPGTSGFSQNYLIEAQFLEQDEVPVVLPYYNASNPSLPYSGPSNSGTAQNTQRQQIVSLQLKAGTAATTGAQTTPSVDAGWVGAWVITVAHGQTTITSSSISVYPGAPFIENPLTGILGNNTSVYTNVSGTQYVSVNGATPTTTGASTFNPPASGIVEVELCGGGGPGGFAVNWASGGGGSGGRAKKLLTGLSTSNAISITVGLGGTSPATGGGTGVNGATSSFGSYVSATGGNQGSSGAGVNAGGSPGYGVGGDINDYGSWGGDSIPLGQRGGDGGGPGNGRGTTGYATGVSAEGFGGGGGGGGSSSTNGTGGGASGGSGMSGFVKVRF